MENQCGCGTSGFQPSHSIWVYNNDTINKPTFVGVGPKPGTTNRTKPSNTAQLHPYLGSAILRLTKRISKANATLCFACNSIDLQFYKAIENNLRRLAQLKEQHHMNKPYNISLVISKIPVNNTTKPGNTRAGHCPFGGFTLMADIEETIALFNDYNIEGNSHYVGRFRYYKFYGWSPWNVDGGMWYCSNEFRLAL